MKCDYCKKESTHSCGAYLLEVIIPIHACDDHFPIAYNKQQGLLRAERYDEMAKSESWNYFAPLI